MSVHAVAPDIDSTALLPGAQFIDAWSIAVDDAALNARHAAERMLGRPPRWTEALMALRNVLVAPFGLQTPVPGKRAVGSIGIFPVVSETPGRLVAGFNDSHLDFRVVVDVIAVAGDGSRVTATTLVLTHNWFGRTYLAIILPFHRLIVRAMLAQVAG